jgi:hypothetical protein
MTHKDNIARVPRGAFSCKEREYMGHTAKTAQHKARKAATHPAVTGLARLGYVVKGVIYIVIGFLALLLVTGHGGQTTDQNGALKALYSNPLGIGRIFMVIVTIGLFSFSLWNFFLALLDIEHQGHTIKGSTARVGYAILGISYGLLGVVAYQITSAGSTTASSRNSTSSAQNWTGLLLTQPAGPLLVILTGIIVLGVAAYLIFRASRATFVQQLHLSSLSARKRLAILVVGRFGHIALSVVLVIIGFFLIMAAVHHNPGDAKGLDGALFELLTRPFGSWLLGIVALGLFAYGIYAFIEARYRVAADKNN